MFNSIVAKDLKDYFLKASLRPSANVYFYRLVGYNEESLKFLSQYYFECKKYGIYINKTINNPSEREVNTFYNEVGMEFVLDKSKIDRDLSKWIPAISQKLKIALVDGLFLQMQELKKYNDNMNILKTTYIKFMCWLRFHFQSLFKEHNEESIFKILYEGNISKYELYFLKVLSYSGCDVLLVNFQGDESYLKIDKRSQYSNLITYEKKGKPTVHFTEMDWEKENKINHIKEQFDSFNNLIVTNLWMKEDFYKEILKDNSERGKTNIKKFYNMFLLYLGIDNRDEYENRLFLLRESLSRRQKKFILIENKIDNPSIDEVSKIRIPSFKNANELIYNLSEDINFHNDKNLNYLIKKAFLDVISLEDSSNLGKLKNKAVCILCWLKRYSDIIFENYNPDKIATFIYYGPCNYNEGIFLKMLSKLPVDVIIICPDLEENIEIEDKNLRVIKLNNSMKVGSYPKKERKIQRDTVAYEAERELDTLLYTDTGLFRNRQFVKSMPITLRTTYDEIDILWREQSKFRPHFEEQQDRVTVPTIFAKVCGVKDGDITAYWDSVRKKVTENTIVIKDLPYLKGPDPNPIKPYVAQFYRNNKLQIQEIKKHKFYQYDYLSENVQDYILDKIQELIDLKWIEADTRGIEYAILSTLLNLDKKTIRLIQNFDFVGEIPKLLVIDTTEKMCSLEDCIYIAFLNLIGFDVLIYAPTGYRTTKYLKDDILKIHEIGEYKYDLIVPRLSVYKEENKGFFGKLFGKGKR